MCKISTPNQNNPYINASGYRDQTCGAALRKIMREEQLLATKKAAEQKPSKFRLAWKAA